MERSEICVFSWKVEVVGEKKKLGNIKNERLVANSFDSTRKQRKLNWKQMYVFIMGCMGDDSFVHVHFNCVEESYINYLTMMQFAGSMLQQYTRKKQSCLC
jgi:hypothetical protein